MPQIIARPEHSVSRRDINPNALKVLYRLHDAGFEAHLVGGGVRDLLLGLHPKDFDVATNAHPDQVRKIFNNSRLIGRRFQIVHVFFGRDIVEVTTFRKGQSLESEFEQAASSEMVQAQNELGILLRDNSFGSIAEDAIRRDFTVNALYYNIADFSITDYVDGMEDLNQRVMRLIGEPEVRFREDPVRMLRAVRLAGKLNFKLDSAIVAALPQMKALLHHVSKARLFDELIKILMSGKSCATFELMLQYDLLDELMPSIPGIWQNIEGAEILAKAALINTDKRIKEGKTINPAFMLAVLYWPLMQHYKSELEQQDKSSAMAFDLAGLRAIETALRDLSVPRRFTANMREIWYLQRRFLGAKSKRLLQVLALPKFRAGYDFLLLRAEVDPNLQALADWWTEFYEASEEHRLTMLTEKVARKRKRKK